LTLEDVQYSSLNPLFVLLEAMESLELIKGDVQRATDKESELISLLDALRGKSIHISSCSLALNIIIEDY